MRIAIAADHAGYRLKGVVVEALAGGDHEVHDLGTDSEEPVDYPAVCAAAGRAVTAGRADRAIVIGGSGQGEAMVANKVHGVRAALCLDEYIARLARQHNDANVLAMGARVLADAFALRIVEIFITTPFEGGRHQSRLDQFGAIEREECGDQS
jgi:ribose 5-phosphate isomerase B